MLWSIFQKKDGSFYGNMNVVLPFTMARLSNISCSKTPYSVVTNILERNFSRDWKHRTILAHYSRRGGWVRDVKLSSFFIQKYRKNSHFK